MDVSKLSDADLEALATNDMSRVSDAGLQHLSGDSQPEKVAPVTAGQRMGAVSSGSNAGIAGLAGLPVDTVLNVWDMLKAGAGTVQGAMTGQAPSSAFDPTNRENITGSSAQLRNLMNRSAVTSTQLPRPDDTASRYLYAGGAALPGVMLAQPQTLGQTATAVTQNVLPSLAAQGASDASKGTQYEATAPILASLATQAAPSAISYAAKGLTPKPDAGTARAAKTLRDAGVQLDAAQKTGSEGLRNVKRLATDNPFTGPAQIKKAQQQSQQYTQAVLKRIGEDASAATPEVLDRANNRIGGTMDAIASRTAVAYDKKLQSDLADILDTAGRELSPDQLSVISKQVDHLSGKAQGGRTAEQIQNQMAAISAKAQRLPEDMPLDHPQMVELDQQFKEAKAALSAVQSGKSTPSVIEGKAIQNMRSSLGRLTMNQDGSIRHFAGELQSALDDALQRSAKGQDYAALTQARRQYRALKQIEPAIDKTGDGMISPARLANAMAAKGNRKQFFYGRGDQKLVALAQAGNKLLPDKAPNSGTPARGMLQYLPGAAVTAAAHMAGGNPIPAAALGIGTYALPKILQSIINSPTALTGQQQISDPRLLQYAAHQGLLSNMGQQ